MTRQQLGGAPPELVALCRLDETRNRRIVGWAMLVAERVVAYVPEHPRIAGGGLLNTYSSLDSVDRLLAHAGIHSVREWPELLSENLAEQRPTNP
ncbi:MAG TPA: hypothetical protein VHH34_05320 [Pseudonocardiaceae bacterium]|nr:hypothetical protein [Pseudonocardiaceae bacterium]